MIKALRALLPPGSLFNNIGPNFTALLQAVAWQFQQVKDHFEYQKNQGNAAVSDHLDTLATEFNIDIHLLTEEQARLLLAFVKHNELDMTKAKFFAVFTRLFPNITLIMSPVSVLGYEAAQVGAFVVGGSEVSGYINNQNQAGGDVVYVQGTVASYQELRFLKWFLERYDRAKHKHIFAVITQETHASAMVGVGQVGAMQVGAYNSGSF